ncbi:MAG: hypothetical protein M1825_003441 [Sarcosagium campestre]|nr:MAG: hypothetical protein M1825_003441 [Sarcosagium campestre]
MGTLGALVARIRPSRRRKSNKRRTLVDLPPIFGRVGSSGNLVECPYSLGSLPFESDILSRMVRARTSGDLNSPLDRPARFSGLNWLRQGLGWADVFDVASPDSQPAARLDDTQLGQESDSDADESHTTENDYSDPEASFLLGRSYSTMPVCAEPRYGLARR